MSRNKQMLIYILKRLGLMILTFVAIFFICFVIVRLLPVNVDSGMKDPEIFYINMVAQGRMRKNANGEYENIPVLEQLGTFLARLFNPSTSHRWGYSYKIEWLSGPDEVLFKRLPPTIMINIFSMLISTPIGIAIGIYMALRKNKWQDHVLSVLVMLFISVPSFVYAFLLQVVFGYTWAILPPLIADIQYGYFTPEVIASMIKNHGVYFAAVGGAGALLSRQIKKSRVIAYDDLGTEAIREMYVEDFPVIVVIDSEGNDLYEQVMNRE